METDSDNISVRVASFSCYLDTAKENSINRSFSSPQESPILLTSPKPTKTPSNNNNNIPHSTVDSFSYLHAAGENFVIKVPNKNPSNILDPTHDHSFSFRHEIPKNDTEISVFGADKYFNMKLHEYKQPRKIEVPADLPRNPSLCSEASTLNSQTPFLPNLKRVGSQTKQKGTIGKRIFGGFGCGGVPCFENKDVHTMNKIVVPYGSNPTQTAVKPSLVVKNQIMEVKNLEEVSRKSIEVFGSATVTSKEDDVAKKMERKLSVLTWDAIIPKGEKNRPPSNSTMCDDMASEASSDLFEIEQISGTLYPLLSTEDSTRDDLSSCMSPQSHYAPSEKSIQWSVVTASAADYSSSVLSDYNDEMSVSVAGEAIARTKAKNMTLKSNEAQKSRGGGLLRCNNYKAVDVVAENVRGKSNKH